MISATSKKTVRAEGVEVSCGLQFQFLAPGPSECGLRTFVIGPPPDADRYEDFQ